MRGTWGTRDFVVDGLGFFAGETGDVGCGVFVGDGVFGDVSGMDLEGIAGLSEKFASAGRGGGEDEHREIIAKTEVRDQVSGIGELVPLRGLAG
jgi:hypothetical protein